MLNIFTDNWDKLPTLNGGERLVRIITDNPYDELYTIVNDCTDDDDIVFALHHKLGKHVQYGGTEDMMHLYEYFESAQQDANDAWDGEGYYRIGWSDGGMDWTSNGPVWFDDESDLASELLSAYDESTDTHLPYAEKVTQFQRHQLESYLGEYVDDYDIDAIIEEVTFTDYKSGNLFWIPGSDDEMTEIVQRHMK